MERVKTAINDDTDNNYKWNNNQDNNDREDNKEEGTS